jgi:uncharacterized protein involved in response to NO
MTPPTSKKRSGLRELGAEPFRILFPAGACAGMVGVALWPLHFSGLMDLYPGQAHARIMAYGLFGAFILGFLGTAMPRMLSARPLHWRTVLLMAFVHAATVTAFATNRILVGDILFLGLMTTFAGAMVIRAKQRKDTPPPGFILVALSFLCVVTGGVLAILQHFRDLEVFWITLQRLLSYQGFVLLPILGIGPFILPRLFGIQSQHNFPEMMIPAPAWWRKAGLALTVGALVIASFIIEATGWHRFAYALRFGTTLAWLILELPFHRAPATNALGVAIRFAFIGLAAGFLAVAMFPAYRVSLLHLTLIGGFAVVTFVVATRVVYGHSGNLALLARRNGWLLVSVGLMLIGMATRISGDFWPKVLASHYTYGALLWIAGVLVWSAFVLPKVLIAEAEEE